MNKQKLVLTQSGLSLSKDRPYRVVEVHNSTRWDIGAVLTKREVADIARDHRINVVIRGEK